eukprot:m51a1_g10160 hypothetical protein (858) ;mRNA; r:27426-31925
MLPPAVLLLLLPAAALCSVLTQYNSASDTGLALRVAITSSCRDVYATPRKYSDAHFLFRELPALDGSGGVSLMPSANDGLFLCDDGSGSGRLVAASPASLSPALCSFRKVVGLSDPSLVSFEQMGRYVAYARPYDYDCASWFAGMSGWTVGLVPRPADAALATWVAAESSPLNIYVQNTPYWLCDCNGVAVFSEALPPGAVCLWDAVPALAPSAKATGAVSLRLHNTSRYLGVTAEEVGRLGNGSAALGVRNCTGSESACTWTMAQSIDTGDFYLTLATTALTSKPANCSVWFSGSCALPKVVGVSTQLLVPIVVVGGVCVAAVVVAAAVTVALVVRTLHRKADQQLSNASAASAPAPPPRSSADAPTAFFGVTADTGITLSSASIGSFSLGLESGLDQTLFARESLASYNSASDTGLALRVAITSSCRDVYATPRSYSDAQFLFRELPALDGSGGVSLMPSANDGLFLCDDGSGSGRLVAASPASLSPALCSFRKVAGLSDPSLVSFEQRGRYVAYARPYDYDCASWFAGMSGWTVGLVPRPADAALATWVAAESSPLNIFVLNTDLWLCDCDGVAVFSETIPPGAECLWDAVPALAPRASATGAVSLRLHNTSRYLGMPTESEGSVDNDSASAALRVGACTESESECAWTMAQSIDTGEIFLALATTALAAARQDAPPSLRCSSVPPSQIAVLALQSSRAIAALGLWRPGSRKSCASCVSGGTLCGWCSDVGSCAESRTANCSLWFSASCALPSHAGSAEAPTAFLGVTADTEAALGSAGSDPFTLGLDAGVLDQAVFAHESLASVSLALGLCADALECECGAPADAPGARLQDCDLCVVGAPNTLRSLASPPAD